MKKKTEGGRIMVELAHAKINLFLEITGRRPDGYHELPSSDVSTIFFGS